MPDRGATPVGDPAAGELTAAERAVLAAIDDAALVAQLVDLVRVPSITGTDAESQLQEVLAGQLRAAGLEVDAWKLDLDALRAEPGFPGTEAERVEGYGVVGLTPGDGEPALVLQGHVDVVPIGVQAKWDGGDPFSGTIRNGVLHGRGACDMKAGVAVNLAVLRALMRSGVRFERRLAIHSVVSEEDGGLGAFATLRRGHGGEAAVITEPTSGRIVTASAGALTFRIEVTGRAAHAATPLEGRSAFEAFWPINLAIRELEARRNSRPDPLFDDNPLPYAIVVGKIHAGDWASSVPDLLVADGRLGVRLDEDPAQARAEFEQALAAAAARDPWLRDHPLRVTWPGGQFAPGQLDGAHPLIGQVQTCIADTGGQPARPAAAPYGSDLRLYAGIGGIPTLHYGPGDVRFAHAPREQVDVAETLAVTRALALLAARRLGAHL